MNAEFAYVEEPFLNQLACMGWSVTTGNPDDPSNTGRQSLREVILEDDLRKALSRINLNAQGKPWLDEGRLTQAVNALKRLGTTRLLEANQAATALLLGGTVVDGVEGWEQGRGRTVHFVDWEHPENNTFRAVSQFWLACPEGQSDKAIIPDIVLFLNGIPVVVVEAKSPTLAAPLEAAVDQLQRYANRRRAMGLVDVHEGNEQLFHYVQFLVATCGEEARVGTFSSLAVHYLAWKDTSPLPMAEVAAELRKGQKPLTQQEMLVAGMLRPGNLLDILRHFTLFMEANGQTIKLVCRYQQFRAVQRAVSRMATGKTREQDGELDRRGGVIWHTQGSGKSLTMVFLIRKMRSHPTLRSFKVVVVTDRRDLQKQLADTASLTGDVLTIVQSTTIENKPVSSYQVLQEVLRKPGKDLVFAKIQMYRGELIAPTTPRPAPDAAEAPPPEVREAVGTLEDTAIEEDDEEGAEASSDEGAPKGEKAPPRTKPLPVLNTDPRILVLVDEAHRSHTSSAHANLLNALPNCVKIGFTGTPILKASKANTTKIFGEELDRYTIRQAEEDGAVVPILYEGRTARAAVEGAGTLDQLFEDILAERTPEELEAIKKKYATKGHVAEAEHLIDAKARNMLWHYVEHILPNGFKAQVVAVSRLATLRYYNAFLKARDALVADLEALSPDDLNLSESARNGLAPERQFLLRAHRFLPTLKVLEFAPVFSGAHNDLVDPTGEWSNQSKIDLRILRFKKPLFAAGPNTFHPEKTDPLAFLIVKSMLLTGFDAPIEQVMYLDRHIQEAELLQAIARVNRTWARGGVEKGFGIVVDYYGVAQHLKEALKAYAAEDVAGALQSLKDEIPKLRDQHLRAMDVFASRGIADITDTEACIMLLGDEKLRAEFYVKLKQFLATLDLVLPRPEALEYVNDAKTLSFIQTMATRRYRADQRLIGKEVGAKVRALIDQHIVSLGVDTRIPPVDIGAADFDAQVDATRSSRAQASEMEHALRAHIRKHLDEDPTHYATLSERLASILQEFEGRWEQMVDALKALVQEARAGRKQDDTTGLDPVTQAPFFALLKQELAGDAVLEGEVREALRALTVDLVAHIQREIGIVEFWSRPQAQNALRSWIFQRLDEADLLPLARIEAVTDRLMELSRANAHRLVKPSA